MYCLRYWARYVRKGEVKSEGIKIGKSTSFLKKKKKKKRAQFKILMNYGRAVKYITFTKLLLQLTQINGREIRVYIKNNPLTMY